MAHLYMYIIYLFINIYLLTSTSTPYAVESVLYMETRGVLVAQYYAGDFKLMAFWCIYIGTAYFSVHTDIHGIMGLIQSDSHFTLFYITIAQWNPFPSFAPLPDQSYCRFYGHLRRVHAIIGAKYCSVVFIPSLDPCCLFFAYAQYDLVVFWPSFLVLCFLQICLPVWLLSQSFATVIICITIWIRLLLDFAIKSAHGSHTCCLWGFLTAIQC